MLAGAGCSTPSGIPDYRDRSGAWKQRRPMSLAEFTGSASGTRASRRRSPTLKVEADCAELRPEIV